MGEFLASPRYLWIIVPDPGETQDDLICRFELLEFSKFHHVFRCRVCALAKLEQLDRDIAASGVVLEYIPE